MVSLEVIKTKVDTEPFNNEHVMKIYEKYLTKVMKKIDEDRGTGARSEAMVIDVFARNQNFATITNDMDPQFKTTYNMEANECLELLHREYGDESVDIIVFDPPYSSKMLKQHYGGIGADLEQWHCQTPWVRAKKAAAKLLKVGGYFIHLGWHTKGLGTQRGFDIIDGAIFSNVGTGSTNDIIMIVEQKIQQNLSKWLTCEEYEEYAS